MTNQNSSKRKPVKEVYASTSKDPKTPNKRGRKVVPPINRPTLPMVLDFIEDTGLQALAVTCKNLQELRVFPSDPFDPEPNVSLTEHGLVAVSDVLSGCESLRKLEIRDCPYDDDALLANAAKLETMRSLWMSSCSVSFGACKLLSQKMPRLNIEIIDEMGPLDTQPRSCPVDKLYIYRTVDQGLTCLVLFG